MAGKRKIRRSKQETERIKPNVREKISEALELPKEVLLNASKLSMIDGGNLIIENYKGIIEYENERIRVNTGKGIIKINGQNLIVREITSENILIDGQIQSLEFLR